MNGMCVEMGDWEPHASVIIFMKLQDSLSNDRPT